LFASGIIVGVFIAPVREKEVIRYQISDLAVPGNSVEMLIPAVDQEGTGVAGKLITTVKPGSGLVLVNVNDVIAQYATQLSGRTAAKAAAAVSQIDLNNLDIIYTIKVNATAIEGPSAGAAMAVSIVAALENKTIRSNVSITGVINEDGSISPAGGIAEKARAARENGVTTFLVPVNQSFESKIRPERECELIDDIEYCTVTYIERGKNVGEILGLRVVEVSTLQEALKYFVK
jgi:uncharacterized protein